MATPAEPDLTFADLGQTRKELARLESLKVISPHEAEDLRAAVAAMERELETRVRSSDWEGAGPLYRLLRKLALSRDEVHLPPALARRLEDYYAHRRSGLVRTIGSLSVAEPADFSSEDAGTADAALATPAAVEPGSRPDGPATETEGVGAAPGPAARYPLAEADGPGPGEGWSLARFLESVNIGWGMLAASLLIVGCSIALVITLWQSDVPLVRYLAFLGVTLGLNGVGQLAYRRLGLAITGNTLLAVSMVLMPLNLVAAEVLGGPGGRAVSPAASAVILIGFAAVAWSSFRLVWRRGALRATLAFAGLIGLQLAVAPLRERGPGSEMTVAWVSAAAYLAGLAVLFRRRRDEDAIGPVPLLFTGGLLAFAHLLLCVRIHLDGLGQGRFDLIAPVVVLHLLGGLMIGRQLRREVGEYAWAGTLAAALDTVIHFAVPLVLLVMAPANGARLLVPALAAIALYGTVAMWYRSRLAVAAVAALTGVAYYAGLTVVHESIRGSFSWLPVTVSELGFQMLPVVGVFLVVGEAFARRRRAGSENALAWASPVLLVAGCFAAAILLGTMVLDRGRLGEAVAVLGGLALVLSLLTRRSAYAQAALASLPIVLALRPGMLEDVIDPGALVVWLGAVGIAYLGAGLALARIRSSMAAVFERPFLITSVLMLPPIVGASFLPTITDFSVLGPLAGLLICAGLVRVHPVRPWPAIAGAFYTLAAGLAIHHWVGPISRPVPASVAWALAAAVPPFLLRFGLQGRTGVRARLFGDVALDWGLALVLVQPMAYLVTPVGPTTAICSGAAAVILVAAAGVDRRSSWTWLAAGFLGLTGFLVYHLIDPIGGRFAWAPGTGATVPTWIPLAPLFTAIVLLGGAAAAARGWRRKIFAGPFVVASIAAAIVTVLLTFLDPIPARKVWTLALAVLPLLAIHFRLTRQPVFLLGIVGMLWQAMIGLVAECINVDATVNRTEFELFTALLAGTAAVAAVAAGLERLLELHSKRRPAGIWLEGISLRILPISSRVLGLGAVFLIGFVAMIRFLTQEHDRWNGPAWPVLLMLALVLLIGTWSASTWLRRKVRFLLSIGITGLVAVGWLAYLIDTPLGWRWLSFGFALHAVVWLAPGRLLAPPRRVIERFKLDRAGWTARAVRIRALVIGQASTALALIVAALHPDHPASVSAGALLAGFWLWLAARARNGSAWLPAAVVLGTVTAFAALHRVHPVLLTARGVGFDPDRLFPHAVLAAVLAAVWYGLGRWSRLRGSAGRSPVFHAGLLRSAGFVLSLVALGLLGIMVTPALEAEPTGVRADYVGGAVLILLLTAAYLVAAAWERRPVLVFLAEACVAGFCVYLRITHPWIYRTDLFRRFWPLILVAVSYGATILEQLLQRLRVDRVYLGPLRYTGLILPIGPLVGVWFRPEIDTTLISTVGAISGFYALVAYLHRSTMFAYVSTAIANATMIAWAQKLGWAFTVHPQIFLWPIGLSLLGIAHVQRRTLPAGAVQALRGIGACIIYGSMATAIFTDVRHQNLEMILLAVVALTGITAGIGLKIRAFLYAGFGFLIFDVGYMVFRAGREDTWVWWMAGIALGVLVLLAFAFFEKRKQEVERWVKTLRTWD